MDTERTLVKVQNGLVDLKNEELLRHSPDGDSLVQLPVNWDPFAKCDRWVKFLEEIFPGAAEKITLLQQFFGYCFLDTCKFEKCLFMYGSGPNGKSTVLSMMEDIVGVSNCSGLPLRGLSHPFNIPNLMDKIINVAEDFEACKPKDVGMLKMCVAGDLLRGEHMHGPAVEFYNRAKFIFVMNYFPIVTDEWIGFGRRVLLLNFTRRFEKHDQDFGLLEKLKAERDGIFMWACAGAHDLIKNGGFTMPVDVGEDPAE